MLNKFTRIALFMFAVLPNIALADTCTDTSIEFVEIPAGDTYIQDPLGTDRTPLRVDISVPAFCIMVNEVSVQMYTQCITAGACDPLRGDQSDPTLPVHSVEFNEVLGYIHWLSDETGRDYRLPSEAEWQRAALADSENIYPWRVWLDIGRPNIFSNGIVPVGETDVNPFGVRDMIGNVAEFVGDCPTRNVLEIPTDGSAFLHDSCSRVSIKGGDYSSPNFLLTPIGRPGLPRVMSSPQIGFRLARQSAQN